MSRKNGEMIVIRPEYVPLPEKPERMTRLELDEYISARSDRKKRNVTKYFDELYDNLLTEPSWRGKRLVVRDPLEYGVSGSPQLGRRVDCLKLYNTGPVYGEIKVTSFQNAKFWCSPKQFLRLWQLLEDRLMEGDELPAANYGFIRYGVHIDGEKGYDCQLHECERSGKKVSGERHSCDNRCLTKNLVHKTTDLTIVPINFVLACFMSDRFRKTGTMNQETSRADIDVQDYFWLKGKISTALQGTGFRKPVQSMEQFFGDSISSRTYDVLGLRNLRIVRGSSPENIYCLPSGIFSYPYKVKPFSVVRLEADESSQRGWNGNFQYYGRDILKFCLGINDLDEAVFEPSFFDEGLISVGERGVPF